MPCRADVVTGDRMLVGHVFGDGAEIVAAVWPDYGDPVALVHWPRDLELDVLRFHPWCACRVGVDRDGEPVRYSSTFTSTRQEAEQVIGGMFA